MTLYFIPGHWAPFKAGRMYTARHVFRSGCCAWFTRMEGRWRIEKYKKNATANSRPNLPMASSMLNREFSVDISDRTRVGTIIYCHPQKGWL